MKKIKITLAGIGVAAISCLHVSCSRETPERVSPVSTDFNNKAVVQIFEATVAATRNYVYVNGSAVTGSTIGAGSVFPASGVGFNVDGGLKSFLVRDTQVTITPVTTQIPYSFAQNLNPNAHYTIFLYDTTTSMKQKTVLDKIVIPADTTSRIRFANFIYSTSAVPNVDVYSYYKGANVFTNVAVTDVTDFVAYPSRIPVDTLYIRETGTLNLLVKVPISVLTPKRNYTLVNRGSYKGTRAATFYATY